MKQIVVGLDADTKNDWIVDWIERFASDTGVHVIVVHAAPRVVLWTLSSMQADFTTYLRNVRAQLGRDVLDRLRRKGISAELVIARGFPARELAGVAARRGADMIVIGGADHSALHDVVLGGTARHLEHLSHVPVVVVPLKSVSTYGNH